MSARAWFRRVRRVGALTGVVLVCTVGAAAQTTPERTDIGGFSRYHTYVRLEPFEYFDPQVANVILRFTDLELPGDGGRVLRFTRTYNNMVEPSNWMHTLGWSFGIEGFVTSVWGTGFLAPGTPINNTTPEPFRTGGVQLVTSDGGIKQTFYMQTPVPGEPIDDNASQRWVKSVDHLKYDQVHRRLYMPDGTVCQYEPPPSAQWVAWLTSCENAFGHTFLTIDRTGSAPQITTTFTQHLSSGQTREVVYAPGPGSTMTLTYGARTWVYTMANGKIVAVTPPDGPGWTFGYAEEFSDPAYPYLTHVITPGGGRIDYTYVDRYQMEHEIPPPPWPDGPVPPVYHGRFLDSRQVSGPDVTPGRGP